MKYKRFEDSVVVRMDRGDEIHQQLEIVVNAENIRLARVEGIGAVDVLDTGVYDTPNKCYHKKQYRGAYEILSLLGTITTMNGNYYPHLHICASDLSGSAVGGHLNMAVVSATAELVLHVIKGTVNRKYNDDVGINTLDFEEGL